MHWEPFQVPLSRINTAAAVFQFSDRLPAQLPRLKRWHSFLNDNFLFLSDGKRYLLTGYMYEQPWQFHCRALPLWNSEFIYYYVFEPLLLDLLKKWGILVWHSAAVARDGSAILLPGLSGSGKSTTTLNLLTLGYRFIGDDTILVKNKAKGLEVTGYETGLYLTDRSLELLPQWSGQKRGRRLKRGQRWKYRIDLTSVRPKEHSKPPLAKVLLFPQVTRRRESRIVELTEGEALVECLRQAPKEFPASLLGPTALENQFEIYSKLVSSARCYRIFLGSDQDHVRKLLAAL
jgi:hypothetical protein